MANIIVAELDLDDLKARGKLKTFEKKAGERGKKAGESFGKGFGASLLGNLGANVLSSAFRGIQNELNNVVSAGANLEVIETQFRTLLKSSKAAEKQLSDLQKFAASTPFQLPGLSLATRQLLSFGVAQADIIPTLRQIGDLAAGTGSDIADLTIPFGRLVSTQKLTLVELDKFADRGINLYGKLSEQTGISLKNIRDEISKGRVPFDEFTKALNGLTREGGLFFGATEKQSKTLAGTLSTLGDNLDNLRANLGKLFGPLLIKAANLFIGRMQTLNKELKTISIADIQKQFVSFNRGVIDFLIKPLELFKNIGNVVFDGIRLALQGVVSSLGFLGGKFAEFLNTLGIKGELAADLKTFQESSAEVFDEFAKKADESVKSVFDTPLSENAAAFNQELAASLDTSNAIVQEKAGNIQKTTQKVVKEVSKTVKAANRIINQGFVKAISGGIQTVIQALASGENAFQAFGKFLLSTFGDLAIQLGEFYIAQGLANLALLTVDPTAQIATGAALVALGSILKAFAGGGVGGTGGVAASGGALATSEDRDLTEPEEIEERQPTTTFNIEIQGSLVQQEELGQFITEVQNEAREKNGILDTNLRVI